MAALCHDVGHLPFSHAAEKELLPDGYDHERLTKEIIKSNEMVQIWDSMRPHLVADDIVKLAVGPKKADPLELDTWESILAEIVIGDAFGADRMDYLLRDLVTQVYHTVGSIITDLLARYVFFLRNTTIQMSRHLDWRLEDLSHQKGY